MNPFTQKILIAMSMVILTGQSQAASRASLNEQNLKPESLVKSAADYIEAQNINCREVSKYANHYVSVSGLLQACLDQIPEKSRVLLPPGKYILTQSLVVKKSVLVGTQGQSALDSAPCDSDEISRCASLLLSAPTSPNESTQGMIHIAAPNVILDHLIIDGDRSNPLRKIYDLCRNPKTRIQADNITVDGHHLTIANSVIKNTPCSTGTEVRGTSVNLTFVNNFVGPNGVHTEEGMWADGLTIHNNANALVSGNVFFNNTDVDLIFGGCQNCLIQKNRVLHDESFVGSSFTGIMVHSWSPEAGDYRGTVLSNNEVNCGPKKRCGFGLYLGSYSWYKQPMFGGEYRNNLITNAMIGLNIDRATGPVTVTNNTVRSSGGRFFTSCGMKDMAAVNISPASRPFVSYTGATDLLGFQAYEGCIPNWWMADHMN